MSNKFVLVPLHHHFNNNGISLHLHQSDGDFDCYGQTYPSEELPQSGEIISVDQVEFLFPIKKEGYKNNIAFNSQTIQVPENGYSFLHLLGASDGGSFEEEIGCCYESGVAKCKVGLTDFFEKEPRFGETVGLRCSHYHTRSDKGGCHYSNITPTMWHQRIKLNERQKGDVRNFV